MRPTQQERKAETRTRLLAAAAELFAERGIDAVSVDTVAERAGRTSGAIYAHFGSKQDLLIALLESSLDSANTVLMAEVAVSGSADDQLRAVWSHMARSASDDAPDWSRLEQELRLRASRDPSVARILRRRSAEARTVGAGTLQRWATTNDARPVADPDRLFVLVRALLNGLAAERRLDPDRVDDDLALVGLRALLGLSAPGGVHDPDTPEATTGSSAADRSDHRPTNRTNPMTNQGARP